MGRLACLAFLVLVMFSDILADRALADNDMDRVRELRDHGKIIPLVDILERIKRTHPQSSLLDAEIEEEYDKIVYEIKIIDQHHRVHELEFDAMTGRPFKGDH